MISLPRSGDFDGVVRLAHETQSLRTSRNAATETRVKIVIISGTNRPGSKTRQVSALLEGFYDELEQEVEMLDLAELPREIFSPGSYAEKPESFTPFSTSVLESAGLHVICPEYNGSLPGVLKYFIDMLPFPESFEHRPVCFTGLAAGMWGALRAVEHLQAIFGYRNAHIYPTRVFLPGIGRLIGDDGKITDAETTQRLRSQVSGFAAYVAKHTA